MLEASLVVRRVFGTVLLPVLLLGPGCSTSRTPDPVLANDAAHDNSTPVNDGPSPDTRNDGTIPDGVRDAVIDTAVDNRVGYDDLIVRSNMMGKYEGNEVSARYQDNSGVFNVAESRTITGGAFEVRWPDAFSRDLFGVFVQIFVDRNSDDVCTSGVDAIWRVFGSNDFRSGEPLVITLDPSTDQSTCSDR